MDRCKALCYSLLKNAVFYCWNTVVFRRLAWESPPVSPGRGCTFPPFLILSISSFCFPQVCAYFFHGNPVDSWRSLVCLYPLKSPAEVALIQYLLQEFRLCTASSANDDEVILWSRILIGHETRSTYFSNSQGNAKCGRSAKTSSDCRLDLNPYHNIILPFIALVQNFL